MFIQPRDNCNKVLSLAIDVLVVGRIGAHLNGEHCEHRRLLSPCVASQ